MYIKDSIIEARIGNDLKKQELKGRIKEIERQLKLKSEGKSRSSMLRERLGKLKEELKLLGN